MRIGPEMPSAIQLRYSGSKGMLALDPTLPGRQMRIRLSQYKFNSSSTILEVAKYTKPSKVYLNRQLIAILEHLRADQAHGMDIFHQLQEEQLMAMSEMLIYEKEAMHQLQTKSTLPLPYSRLHDQGILFTPDPFFRGLLLAIHRKHNSNLANKARLEIPAEYGRTLFGVTDETGTLEYGQVFIQYSENINEPGKNLKVLTGKIVVTKNPCTTAGDVRHLTCVDVPELRHHKDVIVFPQKGPRPHPDEMAGSDLDGDEFSGIWLPALFFEKNHLPMDFPKPPEYINDGPIKVEHMIRWFTEYVKNDQVGRISNAHLAHSDTKGLTSQVCKSLAVKNSLAVDFPKSGHAVLLEREERVDSYPDYMGKHYSSHHSTKLLGQLYRKAHRVEQLSIASIRSKPEMVIDAQLIIPGWQKYAKIACEERIHYCQDLQRLQTQYGVESESEILSGNILRIRNALMMGRGEAYDMEKVLGMRAKRLQEKTRREFFKQFGGEERALSTETGKRECSLKASACYAVTYLLSDDRVPRPNTTELLSFPWICAADLLGDLKKAASQNEEPISAPMSDRLQALIEGYPDTLEDGASLAAFIQKYFQCYCELGTLACILDEWADDRDFP